MLEERGERGLRHIGPGLVPTEGPGLGREKIQPARYLRLIPGEI
ncbi:hypothetical protein [Diplocloster agilis]|nr:hypothetical protein [Diplocloster agilis]